MQNWLLASTKYSSSEKERDSGVFLKRLVMNQVANSIQIGIKYSIFQRIIFFSKFRSSAPRLELSNIWEIC